MKLPPVKFDFGQTVYHRADREKEGLVTGVAFSPGSFTYRVIWSDGMEEKWHYEIELTDEKTFSANQEDEG